VIRLEGASGRVGRVDLFPTTLVLEGSFALVGRPEDGASVALALAAGRERPARGKVTLAGRSAADAARAVGYVPLEPELPDALGVAEVLDLAADIRGEKRVRPAERLALLGLERLAPRRMRTLSRPETRAVALCEALTSSAVRAVLVDEPFAQMALEARSELARALRGRAQAGVLVVVATASPRDARAVADAYAVFAGGRLLRTGTMLDPLLASADGAATLRATVSDARALAAALATDASVASLLVEERSVLVTGPTPTELARAVQRAVLATGVGVEAIAPETLSLERLQAAAAGDAAGAYRGAFERARAAAASPAAPASAAAPLPPSPERAP
jgi:ABC-type multidrug transport system ATPase subunit